MDAQLVEAKVCVFLSKGCFAGRICRLVAKFLSVLQIHYVTCHRAFHICIKTLSLSLQKEVRALIVSGRIQKSNIFHFSWFIHFLSDLSQISSYRTAPISQESLPAP